jgi:hypothetical protein
VTALGTTRTRIGTLIDITDDGANPTFVFTHPTGLSEFRVSRRPKHGTFDEFIARARTLVGHRMSFDTLKSPEPSAVPEVNLIQSRGVDERYDAEEPRCLPLSLRESTAVAGVLKSIRQVYDTYRVVIITDGGPKLVRTGSLDGADAESVRQLAAAIADRVGDDVTITVVGGYAHSVS